MIRNFLFHRVSPSRDPLWDPMDVTLFEKCIKHIKRNYEICLFEDLAFDQHAIKSKNMHATIMFDDGYKDNIEYALPILEQNNIKASFYVVTDCVDKKIPTWTHIFEYSFLHTQKDILILDIDFLPSKFRKVTFENKQDRIKLAKELKPFIKSLGNDHRQMILDEISRQFKDFELPDLMMNWDDLLLLKNLGHYIGSHTVTHTMLGTTNDKTLIEYELSHSAKVIHEKMGYKPITISYPVGSFSSLVKEIAKNEGYKIGLAVNQNVYDPMKEDIFEVSRIELYNEPWWKTKLRISNKLEQVKKLIRYR